MAGTSIPASPSASGVGDGASGMPANMGASHSGMLSMVGTPIGNLGDLTARAAETFRAADVICCEDTRVTSKLLSHLGISKPLLRCDDNVIARRAPELVERVLAGERIDVYKRQRSRYGLPGDRLTCRLRPMRPLCPGRTRSPRIMRSRRSSMRAS